MAPTTDSFDDFEDDGPDDNDAVDVYAEELIVAAEAFGVPIPEDFPR